MLNLWLLTDHLEFLAASKSLARLEVRSLESLGKRLECKISEEWRDIVPCEIAEFFANQLEKHPEDTGWWSWYGITNEPERVLAVSVGFKGWPHEGKVWINCSIAPEFCGRGLATEAITTLTEWAFESGVLVVASQVEENNLPARRVLEKCGFKLCRSLQDMQDGPIILQFERHISD